MDEITLRKAAIIERCIRRVNEEYNDGVNIETDFTKQDSILLNLERMTQASIDMGLHIVRTNKLGIPDSSRTVFKQLEEAKLISKELSESLQKMVGFRNIAIHEYQKLDLEIVKLVIKFGMKDIEIFKTIMLKKQVD